MIKFFRKIRYNLIEKNKTGKYLKYAIGEIVLVVIGILIALSINNSNTINKQRKVEQEYLVSLQTEFKTNLKKINECLKENKERVSSVENMLGLFDNNVLDTISNNEMSNILFSVFGGEAVYYPSTGVLTDIISSGNLNLIQNEQLRQHLASFESALEFLTVAENVTHSRKWEIQNHFNKNGSVRKVLIDKGISFEHKSISDTISNKVMFNSIEFENNLLDYYLTIKATSDERFFGRIKEQIEQILVEVDSEIKK